MSDEPREEYAFDYRQAKPNRFAAAIQQSGLKRPEPSAGTSGSDDTTAQPQAHTHLSEEQKQLLETLYASNPLSVDDLPYTDEMEQLHRAFARQTGLALTLRDVYKALKNLGCQGRLGGKIRATTPAPMEE